MKIRTGMALAVVMASIIGASAQGPEIYKSKCQLCHGASGMADSSVGKAMKVKPIANPEVKKLTEAEMITATRNGMGKMKPFKDSLNEAQIKDAVKYFRTFLK